MSAKNNLEKISENISFGGKQMRYRHASRSLNCEMNFSIFIPADTNNNTFPAYPKDERCSRFLAVSW